MDIYNLPQDIFPDKKDIPEGIIFHNYAAKAGTVLRKSILHKNAISLVMSGEKTVIFAERTVHISDDEFHFLSAGNCLAAMNLAGKDMFSSIVIFFDNNLLNDFYLKYHSLIANIKNQHKLVSEPYVAFKKDAFVLNFISSLNLHFQTGTDISTEMRQLKFEELMLHLLEKYPEKILSFRAPQSRDFDDLQIRKAVETNIVNNVSIEELAFLCNISISTFKRRFTKIYGMPPSKWILLKRMEMAKNLLQHRNEKPSEVFYKIGYENHSSFSQSFKQTFGITPKEFQLQQLSFQP
jgi:AraC-like DNA-binding protein